MNIKEAERQALPSVFSKREADLVDFLHRRRYGCYYNNQEDLENSILEIDNQFYLKYLDMKEKHEEWCLKNDWPLPGNFF